MADKKISDLTNASSLAGGDLIEIENVGGNSRKATATVARAFHSPRLSAITSTTGTPASTTETDLATYAMPAGQVAADGQALRITTAGVLAATTRSRTVRLYLGATLLASITTTNSAELLWSIEAWVTRRSSTSEQIFYKLTLGGAASDSWIISRNGTAAENLANALTVKITGQVGGSPVANDIDCRTFIVEHLS